jgi:hypothetical protein
VVQEKLKLLFIQTLKLLLQTNTVICQMDANPGGVARLLQLLAI